MMEHKYANIESWNNGYNVEVYLGHGRRRASWYATLAEALEEVRIYFLHYGEEEADKGEGVKPDER